MNTPEFLAVGIAHGEHSDGRKLYGLALIKNPAHEETEGTITIRSASKDTGLFGFSKSVITLDRSINSANPNRKWLWAIHHWLGSLSNPQTKLYEAFHFQDHVEESEAINCFRIWENSWRSKGRLFFQPKEGTARKARKQSYDPKLARLHNARLLAVAESWPITAKAIRRRTGAVAAFAYEQSDQRVEVNPVTHELALNGLEYMECTAKEIADKIASRVEIKIKPDTLKKRMTKLGLFRERPSGPKPTS